MASQEDRAVGQGALRTTLGRSRGGDPLSFNRAPAEDLSPWIARVYATNIEADPGQLIECGLVADTPVLRVLFSGDWTAQTRDGVGRYRRSALFFGPQTRRMPVSVTGSFATIGVALKPGAVAALRGPAVADTLDRIIMFDHIYGAHPWGNSDRLIRWLDDRRSPDRWLTIAEKLFRRLVEYTGGKRPDPIVEAFDKAAFADPNLSLADFAREHDIERRRLERMIKKAFGQSPGQVLRRARALDIAANLRGVADSAEAEEIALRYYDQSHLIREFSTFFGMTPKQFARTPQPLMTLTLEARQARRLEVLGRRSPGDDLPWRREKV